MVGLVVATHGRLAEELVATAELIVGPLPAVATCNIDPGASPQQIRQRMREAVASIDSGEGALALVDLFGGTPCKEALMLCQLGRLEVVAGVNLPMILKAHSLRQERMALSELAHSLAQHAQKTITCASDLVRDAHQARRT